MVNKRRVVQELHERFQVGLLVAELNHRHRSSYRVTAEPNPPEAIIQSGKTTSWIEVVTAFWTEEFAKDAYSYATEGEEHVPLKSDIHVGPDAAFSLRFANAMKAKLEKTTYEAAFKAHGPGYLLVSAQYPLFNSSTPRFMREAWSRLSVEDRGYFRSIYLTYRQGRGYRIMRWKLN